MSIESPSSSVSTNAYLFHDVKGNQLRIFTESTIQGRPKLVASLKKAGAINAHIKNAQIILVDSFAESAKSLAAVWRDKVVLDVGWAYQAIGRGSYQGEDEDWGGHCVRGDSVDDGVLPTHASAKSPLPTPRQTPTQRTDFSHVESPASSSRIPRRSETVGGPSTSLPQSLSYSSTSSMISPPSSQTPNLVDGGLLKNDSAPSQRPPSILPFMPSQLTENAASSSQQHPLSGTSITPDAARAVVFGVFGQEFGTVLLQAVQHNETSSRTPPVDVMNDSSAQLQQSVPPSLSQGHASSPYPSSPIFQSTSPAMSDTVHPHQDHRDETVSARNSVPGPSMTPRMKEKRRETFMEPVAKRPRFSTGAGLQPIFRTESGEPLAFFVSMDLNNRNDIVNLIKKNGGKIYADIPHADIVVLAPRKGPFADHLMAAVIAQKPAVQATFVHQCVLERTLLDPGDFSFEGVEAKNRKNQVFTVRLDDLEDRASPLRKSKDERRKKRSGEATGSPTKASPSNRERSPSAEPLVKAEVQHTLVASGGDPCRSPSPIPPTRVVEIGGGRNAFTDEDKEYFGKYVTRLLRRDPQISTGAIARELGKKVRHHSPKSWDTFCGRNGAIIDELRMKALQSEQSQRQGIQTSLAEGTPQSSDEQNMPASSNSTHLAQHMSSPYPDQTQPLPLPRISRPQPPVVNHQALEEEDVEFLTQSLLDGIQDDLSDDEEVWPVLAKLRHCRSASTWKELWNKRGNDIKQKWTQRIESNSIVKTEGNDFA